MVQVTAHEADVLLQRGVGVVLVHLGGEVAPAALDRVLGPAHGLAEEGVGEVGRLHQPLVVVDAPEFAAVVHQLDYAQCTRQKGQWACANWNLFISRVFLDFHTLFCVSANDSADNPCRNTGVTMRQDILGSALCLSFVNMQHTRPPRALFQACLLRVARV